MSKDCVVLHKLRFRTTCTGESNYNITSVVFKTSCVFFSPYRIPYLKREKRSKKSIFFLWCNNFPSFSATINLKPAILVYSRQFSPLRGGRQAVKSCLRIAAKMFLTRNQCPWLFSPRWRSSCAAENAHCNHGTVRKISFFIKNRTGRCNISLLP